MEMGETKTAYVCVCVRAIHFHACTFWFLGKHTLLFQANNNIARSLHAHYITLSMKSLY